MTKILFVCHGNICRSPMAEFFCKDLVLKEGIADQFHIESAATTSEEIWNGRGNPVYPPARDVLLRHGIDPSGKRARLMTNMRRIAGGDPEGKIYGLMDFVEWRKSGNLVAGSGRDVADPWYTRNFEAAWNDIVKGCRSFFAYVNRIAMY